MTHPVDRLAQRLFGPDARAIPFQRKVFDTIAAGRSVVLQAPTGAGKTFAALAPLALGAWGRGTGQPATKLIYSLPLRVLAGSLRDQYRELFQRTGDAQLGADLQFTTQYGGAAEDEFLDLNATGGRGIVFATIDQTLSGFLGVPLSLPNRLANVLYGSVLSGALVFDEVHLLEADKSFTTTLHLLRQSPWPVLVMTATMSTTLRRDLCQVLDAEEIVVGDEDLPHIRSQRDTVKHVEVRETPLDGAALADCLGERTLVLCNTVDRAQKVYEDLKTALRTKPDAPEIMLLHSRFLPSDRADKESKLRTWFGKNSTGRYVLVSTQVVEAGLDISCDTLHTEACPADSFLQRIGRSARFEGEKEARVYVYPADAGEAKGRLYLPYDDGPVEATLDALRPERALRYEDLQDLIDKIHEAEQADYVQNHKNGAANLAAYIYQVRRDVERSANQELVRLVDNVEIVVATEDEVMSRDVSPYAYPAVSLRRDTFRYRYVNEGLVRPLAVVEFTDEAGEGRRNRYFRLEPVAPGEKLPPGRYVVDPSEAAYDDDLGLRLGEPGDDSFPKPAEVPMWTRYNYEEESYQDHIRRVFERDEIRPAALEAIRRLSSQAVLPDPVRDPERLIDLVIWAHDVAKLTDGWQAAHGNRDLQGVDGKPLAHGGRESKPPPHAAEGAWTVYTLIGRLLQDAGETQETWACALWAIRTHHGPRTWDVGAFRIRKERQNYLRQITPALCPQLESEILGAWDDLVWSAEGGEEGGWKDASIIDGRHAPLYALLVYMLRRSDQLATSEVSESEEFAAPQPRPAPHSF